MCVQLHKWLFIIQTKTKRKEISRHKEKHTFAAFIVVAVIEVSCAWLYSITSWTFLHLYTKYVCFFECVMLFVVVALCWLSCEFRRMWVCECGCLLNLKRLILAQLHVPNSSVLFKVSCCCSNQMYDFHCWSLLLLLLSSLNSSLFFCSVNGFNFNLSFSFFLCNTRRSPALPVSISFWMHEKFTFSQKPTRIEIS